MQAKNISFWDAVRETSWPKAYAVLVLLDSLDTFLDTRDL